MSVKTLTYLMGHSSVQVTLDIYTHLGIDHATLEFKHIEAMEEIKEMEAHKEKVIEFPKMA